MRQACATGARLHQPPLKILDQTGQISIQNTQGTIQLESFTSCTPQNKSYNLQRHRHQGLLGAAWHGRLGASSFQGPLSMHLYYVPETSGYHVSSFTDLFPQHCIESTFTPVTHVQKLSEELQQTLAKMHHKKRTLAVLKMLTGHIDAYIAGTPLPQPEQPLEQRVQQRVINVAPQNLSPDLQQVSDATVAPLANIPTVTRILQTAIRAHQCKMKANTPGSLPWIARVNIIEPMPVVPSPQPPKDKSWIWQNLLY